MSSELLIEGSTFGLWLKGQGHLMQDAAQKLGMTRQNLNRYINMEELPEKFLQSVYTVFPDFLTLVNRLASESKLHLRRDARSIGEPVGTYTTKSGNEFIELSEGYYLMNVHHVSIKARAGYMVGWGDEEYIDNLPTHPFVVKNIHKGNYLSFDIDGDSMDDGTRRSIEAGSVALGRQINRQYWKSKLHFKDYPFFIIVHRDGIMCKELIGHDVEKGTIKCHSLNPNKKMYPDFDIQLEDCAQLFNIVKVERDAKG